MPSISPFPHLTLFFFPSLYIPLSATTKQRKKKITLLAPAGAQALGSFLNLLHRTRRAFVLHAANEIRNPNPEKERKILKTKLSPHTTSYRQQYSAAKRRTQTGHRNTQNLQSIDGSITQIADAKASRLYHQRPSFLCLQIGFA
jgi:hypothetical protein